MVTRGNYEGEIKKVGVSNLSKELKEGHDYLMDATENGTDWSFYEEDSEIKAAIDLYLNLLNIWIAKREDNGRETKLARQVPEKKTVVKNVLKTQKEKKAKREAITKVAKKNPKLAKQIREEVRCIKRFVSLHNKSRKVSSILVFVRSLQRNIELEIIRKASPFAPEIEYIQKELVKSYNFNSNKENVTISIPENTLARMVGIAGGEAVYKSVGIIRRYIAMKGKALEKPKVESLLKSVVNANISTQDPFYDRVAKITKSLNQLKNKSGVMEIEKAELGSLEGIIECCCDNKTLGKIYNTNGKPLRKCKSKKYSDARKGACSWNKGLSLGKIYDTKGKKLRPCKSKKYSDAKQGACSYNKGLSGVMTAEDIVNQKFDLLPFSGKYADLIGKPEKNFTMMVHGEPGNGKSSFLIQFAKYLTSLGSVLYVSSEEFGSVTLKNLVTYYMNPLPNNIKFVSNLQELNPSNFDFVIIDSINDLGLKINDFKTMVEKSPSTGFIIVLQHTKSGDFKGGKDWEHLVQIGAQVSNYNINVFRNRYGVKGTLDFYDSEYLSRYGSAVSGLNSNDLTYNF